MATLLSQLQARVNTNERYELVEDPQDQFSKVSKSARTKIHLASSAWYRTSTIRHALAALVLVLVPIIVFAIWIPHAVTRGVYIGFLADSIGGRFTQSQAKAVDFVCSALLGPLLLVTFNKLWFTNIRVTAVDQNGTGRRQISLLTLAEACITDSGSYDMFKFSRLVRSGHPRLLLFAILVLCSAVAKTSFSNMIAYEASTSHSHNTTVSDINSLGYVLPGGAAPGKYNFNQQQKADYHLQVVGMLAALSYQDATTLLDNNTYVGINATRASLENLPQDYVQLVDVPGYRLSLDCRPAALKTMLVYQPADSWYQVAMYTNTTDNTYFVGAIPGQATVLTSNFSDFYDFLAFTPNRTDETEALLLRFVSTNVTNMTPIQTSYGSLPITAFNMTVQMPIFQGSKSIMSFTGLRCKIRREIGKHRLIRNDNLTWEIADSKWEGRQQGTSILLSDWQLVPRFLAPNGYQPGIGTALAASAGPGPECPSTMSAGKAKCRFWVDFEKVPLNYLYAVGEGERIIYEVMNGNFTGLSTPHNHGTFSLQAMVDDQFYKIVYIPFILFAGLLSMFIAALIPFGLLIYTWRTKAVRDWRKLDAVRLVADAVTGLKDDDAIAQIRNQHNSEITTWARHYRLHYAFGRTELDGHPGLTHLGREEDLKSRLRTRPRSERDEL